MIENASEKQVVVKIWKLDSSLLISSKCNDKIEFDLLVLVYQVCARNDIGNNINFFSM